MKSSKIGLWAGLAGLLLCLGTAPLQAENTAEVNEVLKLKGAGVADETIVAFIQSRNVNYDLTADRILALRNQGLSSPVLNAMLARSSSAPATASPYSPPPVVTVTGVEPSPAQPPLTPTQTLPAPSTVVAPPLTSPDVAYFYQELSPHGRWILAEDGQWCWQPAFVTASSDWRPYWDKGHWVWTDQGWFWSSDYTWGWAAFHYGRWNLHPHHGWIWYPDRVWAPAWVAWRSGGEYCGWAPLPPGAVFDTGGGFFLFHGRRVDAGFDFGLGFAHFNFCYTRELGEPMRRHWRTEPEMRAVFSHTTVINHYSVNRVVVNGESRAHLFNHGIEPVNNPAFRGRKFDTVHIQELNTPAQGRGHERMDSKNRTLEVYRPKFGGHR